MDLEKHNQTYIQLKNELAAKQAAADKIKSAAELYRNSKTIQEGKKAEAIQNRNEADKKAAEAEIKKLNKKIEQIQKDTKEKDEEVKQVEEKLENAKKAIMEDPEMKAHLEQVTATRYARDLNVANTEKQALENKIDQQNKVIENVINKSVMKNHLTGLIGTNMEIKQLQEEMDNLANQNDPASQNAKTMKEAQMKDAQAKYARLKNEIMEYIHNHQLGIEEHTITSIANGRVVMDSKTHKINVEASIKGNIEDTNKKLQSTNKKIQLYTRGIENLGYTVKAPTTQSAQQAQQGSVAPTVQIEKEEGEEATKESWWQRTKNRIGNWKWVQKLAKVFMYEEEPKQLAEGKVEPAQDDTAAQPQTQNGKAKKQQFRSSLKYEVVQNLADEMYTQNLREARKDIKQEAKRATKQDGREM